MWGQLGGVICALQASQGGHTLLVTPLPSPASLTPLVPGALCEALAQEPQPQVLLL